MHVDPDTDRLDQAPHQKHRRAAAWRRALWLGLSCSLLLAACQSKDPQASDAPLVTEDLPDEVSIDPSTDTREAPRTEQLSGILPSDFPKDLPLPLPASLVDFTNGADGRSVTLLAPRAMDAVEQQLISQLRNKGWNLANTGSGSYRVSQGGRNVQLTLSDANPGCQIVFRY